MVVGCWYFYLTTVGFSFVCLLLPMYCTATNEREFVAVKQPGRKYVVRRLTTTECARLQGLPDRWAIPLHKKSFTDEEGTFWERVRRTHAEANGRRYRPYAKREQLVCWYNRLRTDSSEYKLYGNGIALPCAAFVLRGVAMAFQE